MDIKKIYNDIVSKFDNTSFENPITPALAKEAVPQRCEDVHKGSCGSLLVCGGSPGLTGAPCLSATAALRCGAGLVTLACASELNAIFEVKLTEAMTYPLKSKNGAIVYAAKNALFEKMEKSSAFLIGPGLSQTKDIKRLVADIIEACKIPLIIDADALNVIAKDAEILKKAKCQVIITPHIGEFARLCSLSTDEVKADKENLAIKFSKEYNCITVLKSHRTIVTTPNSELYTNILGNAGMASGGTGDVLSGCIASFAAQGKSPLTSALAGVYFHSLAGDIAKELFGEYSLLASDIINCIGYAIKETAERN